MSITEEFRYLVMPTEICYFVSRLVMNDVLLRWIKQDISSVTEKGRNFSLA